MELIIGARALRDLLTPMLPMAAGAHDMPVLNAVKVYVDDGRLVALATDRFVFGFKAVPGDWPNGWTALIPLDSAKAILRSFRPVRGQDPELTLTVDGDRLYVETSGGFMDFDAARVGYALRSGDYPDIAKLAREALAEDVSAEAWAGFNFAFLAKFAGFAERGQALALRITSPSRPAIVTDGESFVGGIMPRVKMTSPATTFSDFIAPATGVLAEKQAPAAKRSRKSA